MKTIFSFIVLLLAIVSSPVFAGFDEEVEQVASEVYAATFCHEAFEKLDYFGTSSIYLVTPFLIGQPNFNCQWMLPTEECQMAAANPEKYFQRFCVLLRRNKLPPRFYDIFNVRVQHKYIYGKKAAERYGLDGKGPYCILIAPYKGIEVVLQPTPDKACPLKLIKVYRY